MCLVRRFPVPGIFPEARVIMVEEFRRQIDRRSWQILTLLVLAVLLIGLIAVPLIREAVTTDEPSTPLNMIGYVDNASILDFNIPDRPVRYKDRESGILVLQERFVEAVSILPADYLE
jgi:hypothetical protein